MFTTLHETQFIRLTEKKLETLLKKYDLTSVFIVHGYKSYEQCGIKKIFDSVLKKMGIKAAFFSDFTEDPNWEEAQQGISLAKTMNPSLVIGIGGGSTLDMAKLIRFFYSHTGTPLSFKKIKHSIPLLLFPTTAGTGSEATHFAVCYMNNIKYSVTDKEISATESFIDYTFTLTASPYLTACTGLDALAHAIESYWSIKSTDESRGFAIQAIQYIYPNLLKCITEPTEYTRKQLAIGAHLAGKAINISFTTAAHAYSYGITTYLHLPHGHAVACTLPYFFKLNAEVSDKTCVDSRGTKFVSDRIDELCSLLDIPKHDCFSFWIDYINSLFMYKNILEPTDADIEKIVKSVNLDRLANNPVKVTVPPPIKKLLQNYTSIRSSIK